MKLLAWNVLLFYIAIVQASEVLGSDKEPMPEEASRPVGRVRKARAARFGELTRSHLTAILEGMMRNDSPSLTTVFPATPSTSCATTTEEPEILTTTEPSFLNDNSSLMHDVIVPIIRDIVDDEVALANITTFVRTTVEILLPLATEVFEASNNPFVPGNYSVIQIPRALVESTMGRLRNESKPLLRTILENKLEYALLLLSYNTRALFKSVYEMKYGANSRIGEFSNKIMDLYKKYFALYKNSTADFIYTYSPVEIGNDVDSLLSVFNDESRKRWRNNLDVFQDVSGITTDTVADFLQEIPGYWDVIDAIPIRFYLQMFFLFS